jgi:hypothetical protein
VPQQIHSVDRERILVVDRDAPDECRHADEPRTSAAKRATESRDRTGSLEQAEQAR